MSSDPNHPGQHGQEHFDINFEEGPAPQHPQPGAQYPYGYPPQGMAQDAYYQQQQYQAQQQYYLQYQQQQQQSQAQAAQVSQGAPTAYYPPTGSGVLTPPPGSVEPPHYIGPQGAPFLEGVSQTGHTIQEPALAPPGAAPAPAAGPVSQSSQTIADGAPAAHAAASGGTNVQGLIGRTIDRYKIIKLLGEGGFGAVYKAEHTLMKREVAFKTLHKDLAKDPAVLHRFKKEGQVASRFKHKNAIELYDFGQMEDGTFFMAMEFLSGQDLRDHIKKRGALDLAETFDIMIQTLSALQAAHEGGIVHRDLKPDNIKLENREGRENYVKVLDFGIAKMKEVAGEEQTGGYKTQVGAFFGTPEYGSPEQCAGEEIDGRSDLYTMGVIMYECLTGTLPFVSKTPQGYLAQHMVAPPRPIREIRPDLNIPPEVEAVLMKALEKKREDRYQTANEFIQALIDCAGKCGIPISVEGGGTVVVKTPTWKLAAMIAVPVLAVSAILGTYATMSKDPAYDNLVDAYTKDVQAFEYESARTRLEARDAQENIRPRHEQWFADEIGKIQGLIAKRDEGIKSTIEEVKGAIYGGDLAKADPASRVEKRNYAAAIGRLETLIGQPEASRSPLIESQVKPLKQQIERDREADADEFWNKVLLVEVGRKVSALEFEDALKLIATRWPKDKLSMTPTHKVVEAKEDAIQSQKTNIGKHEIEAKKQLDNFKKFREENPEKFREQRKMLRDLYDHPTYGLTAPGVEARKLDSEVEAAWEEHARQLFERVKADAQPEAAKRTISGYQKALELVKKFPPEHASTKAGHELARFQENIVAEVVGAWENFTKKEAAKLHRSGDVEGALKLVREWESFTAEQGITQQVQALISTYLKNLEIHKDMVFLPEAMVIVGEFAPTTASPPQNPQKVGPLWMMKHEVTNEQYYVYLDDTNQLGSRTPITWPNGQIPPGQEKHPVRGVTWEDAVAFCEWAGLRLPTEVEWEYGARGADAFPLTNGKPDPKKRPREYPWGDGADKSKGHFKPKNNMETAPVGSYPQGDSPFGLSDMAGNVAEWTASEYQRYMNPPCPKNDPYYGPLNVVYRGGSYNDNDFVPAVRSHIRLFAGKTDRLPYVGFRCAKSAIKK